MDRHQIARSDEITTGDGVSYRRLDVALRLKPGRRAGVKLGNHLRFRPCEFPPKHVGEQLVEAVGLAVSVDGYQEQVGAFDLGEHRGRAVRLEHRVAGGAGHLIEDR